MENMRFMISEIANTENVTYSDIDRGFERNLNVLKP